MSRLEAAVKAARQSGDYDALLQELPYARFTGMHAELQGEVVRLRLPFQQSLVGNTFVPAFHGGVVGALLESAALLQLIHAHGLPFPKTIDFTVDYLRIARGEELYAVAEVQRLGRRIANVRMRAYQQNEHEPVALGRGNFLLD
ncbi:MAG: thioesterase superfamily protein [Myxococcaceae bacterium]|nr:thioesterase superfamily protein [Myxococcaceae bacterium]